MSTSLEMIYLIHTKLPTNSSVQCHALVRHLYALEKCGAFWRKNRKGRRKIFS